MRIGTGASILVLAFTEKLLNPDLARAFLANPAYANFNFMRALGFTWFSDDLFITVAAMVEATVGVLLIAGVLPRVVILLMWVPFNAAIPLLPPVELLGHLPDPGGHVCRVFARGGQHRAAGRAVAPPDPQQRAPGSRSPAPR